MSTPEARLASIPDGLLSRSRDPHKAHRLMAWLDEQGFRPSFLEIEQERARRARREAA